MNIELIEDDGAKRWNEYVSRHGDRTFYHGYAWRSFFRDYLGKETFYLAALDGKRIKGVLPLVRQKSRIFGDYMVSLPFLNYGGALVDDDESMQQMVGYLRELVGEIGTSFVELRGIENAGDLPCKTKKVSMRLAMPDSADDLHETFSSKLRSQIKRPLREGPSTVFGGIDLLDRFYTVFSRNMRDLGTPVYSKGFFKEILRQFPDDTDIAVVELNGQPIAAGFLVHGASMTEIPWASSDRRYNKMSVNMLLYWEVLKRSIERGSEVFDFGRSTRDSGTYRFKKQWGAKPMQLHWSYVLPDGMQVPELNPENKRYGMAIRAWQKLPLAVANTIGPMLARNLP